MVHQCAQKRKLYCHQYIPSSRWVQWFLDEQIARIPFSIDPFLGLGTFAQWFLYNRQQPPAPSSHSILPRPHAAAKTAYSLALSSPRGLLPKADLALHPHSTTTYLKPSTWARRMLGLNWSMGLATHIQSSLVHLNHPSPSPTPSYPILLSDFNPHSPHSVLQPLPHYLEP